MFDLKESFLVASAIAGVMAANGNALAADLKAPPPIPSVIYNWSGFYAGVNAGGAFGSYDPVTSAPVGPYLGA